MWAVIGLCLVAIAAVPFIFEAQRRSIDQPMRNRTSGQFVTAPQGQTHFRWTGPLDGPVVVAIHGLTTPSVVWDGITKRMTRAGCRVLTYDLYGRGLSDAPTGAQDLTFFKKQLTALLDDQAITEPFTLMGYSMGGSIAASFAADNTDRVKRLWLVAPAGMTTSDSVFEKLCRWVPGGGDWLHAMLAAGQMRRSTNVGKPNAISEMKAFQLARRGYLPAVLSSRRHALAQRIKTAHRKIAQSNIPVIAVWARNDDAIPARAIGMLAEWNRNAVHVEIDGAGHGVPYTHAAEVAEVFIGTLREIGPAN